MFHVLVGTILLALSRWASSHCIDIHSQVVSQGLHYVPGPNTCTLCICDKGSPKWCKSVLCSPPQNCKSFQIGNSCCEFKCLDDILTNDGYKDTYDLALRLIASAFTALLSLSILFLLYHRLRRRKIRLRQTRPSSEDQRSLNSIGYITGGLGYHPASYGYLGTGSNDLEYPYEPNTQFCLWKPPGNYFPRGEAPPPYEEAVRLSQLEHDNNAASNNAVTATPSTLLTPNQMNNLTYSITSTHPTTTNQVQYQNGCCVLLTRNEGSSNDNSKDNCNAQATSSTSSQTPNDKTQGTSRNDHYHTGNAKKHSASARSSQSEGNKQKSKSFENICERERGGNQASMPTSSEAKHHIYANQKMDPALYKQNFEEDSQRIAAAASTTLNRRCVSKDNKHRTISKTFQSKNKVPAMSNMESVAREPKRISTSHTTRDMTSHRTLPTNLKDITIATTPEQLPDRSTRELSMHKDYILEKSANKEVLLYKNQLPETSVNRELSVYRDKMSEKPTNSRESSRYKKESDINCKTLTKSSNWSTIYIPSNSKTPILDKICQLKENLPSSSTAMENKDVKQTYKLHAPEVETSYQCLMSSQDDDEDYRSECENCKFTGIAEGEEEIPETMTLQRRPLELEEELSYYRTSLTLPTHSKKPSRILSAKPGRESWFLAMDEYSSSDDSA